MNKGFSLIELLVVFVIIGILASIAFTKFIKAKNEAREYIQPTIEKVENKNKIDLYYSGNHDLKKTKIIKANNDTVESYLILKNNNVLFYWKNNNNTFTPMSLNFSKVKFEYDEFASVPTIKFRWYTNTDYIHIEDDRDIIYAVINCKESDGVFNND